MPPNAQPTTKRLRYSMSSGPEPGEYPGWIIKEEDGSDTSCTLDFETASENSSPSSGEETGLTFASSERKRKRGEEEIQDDAENDTDVEIKSESGAESVSGIEDDADDEDDSEVEVEEDNVEEDNVEEDNVEEDNVEEDNVEEDNVEEDNVEEDDVEEDDAEEDGVEEDDVKVEEAEAEKVEAEKVEAEDVEEEDVHDVQVDEDETDEVEVEDEDVEGDIDESKASEVEIDEIEIKGVKVKKYNDPECFFTHLTEKIRAYLVDYYDIPQLDFIRLKSLARCLIELERQQYTDRFTLKKVRETLHHCRKAIKKLGEKVMICNAVKADLLDYGTTSRNRWEKFKQLVGDQTRGFGHRITMDPGPNSNHENLVREITRRGDVYECHRGQLISLEMEMTYNLRHAYDLCPLAYKANKHFPDPDDFDNEHDSDSENSG